MPSDLDALGTFPSPQIMGKHTRSCGTIRKTFMRTLLERIIEGTETRIAEVLSEEGVEKGPGWECLFMHRFSISSRG